MTGAAFVTHACVMRAEDRRGYTLRPGFTSKRVNINSDGFRGPMPDGDRIIVCLGDSVPFGSGVKDGQCYPAHMTDTLNAAVPSYNVRQCVDRLKLEALRRYGWDRIAAITLHAANDVSLLAQFGSSWTPDTTWADQHPSGPPQRRPPAYMLGNLRLVLDELAEMCVAHSTHLVLLAIDPNRRDREYRPHLDVWAQALDGFNRELQKAAHANPWVHYFIPAGRRHIDIIHYHPKTARQVGEALHTRIAEILED